jgi:hypothetical protein
MASAAGARDESFRGQRTGWSRVAAARRPTGDVASRIVTDNPLTIMMVQLCQDSLKTTRMLNNGNPPRSFGRRVIVSPPAE